MDNLDGGRRVVVLTGIILCDSALGGLLPPPLPADGDSEAYETGRKDDGAEGLELCFRSLSLSRGGEGDGESSIMSTHPDVSAAGVRLIPATTSKLGRRDLVVVRSSTEFERTEDEEEGTGEDEGPAFVGGGGGGIVFAVERLMTLGLRNLGTRVSFCSSSFTRARISETICTPLLLNCTEATELPSAEVLRLGVGRETTAFGTTRAGLLIVVERGKRRLLEGVDTPLRGGWKPARARLLDVAIECANLRSGEARS